MNVVIAAIVGAALATATLIGGVNVAQGDQQKVSQEKLYQYADE